MTTNLELCVVAIAHNYCGFELITHIYCYLKYLLYF